MDNKKSRKLLHQLQDEIKNIRAVDEEGRKLLRDLEEDLRALLERSEANPAQLHAPIVQRLESALSHFEATHPDLTMLISKLLDSLSNAGI